MMIVMMLTKVMVVVIQLLFVKVISMIVREAAQFSCLFSCNYLSVQFL